MSAPLVNNFQTAKAVCTKALGEILGDGSNLQLNSTQFQQLAKFLDMVIKNDGKLTFYDANKNKHTIYIPALTVLEMVKAKSSDIHDSQRKAFGDLVDSKIGILKYKSKGLDTKFLKPELIRDLKVALSKLKLSGKTTSTETKDPKYYAQVLDSVLHQMIQDGVEVNPENITKILSDNAENFKLTPDGIQALTEELDYADLFLNAKEAAKRGIENLTIIYSEGFNKEETIQKFSEGNKEGIDLDAVNEVLSSFIKTGNTTKLEQDIAKLDDTNKAFCQYMLGLGAKANSGIDLEGLLGQLSNFMPGILGSGILGYILSSVLGIPPSWGVIGSLAMAALGATAPGPKVRPPLPTDMIAENETAKTNNAA